MNFIGVGIGAGVAAFFLIGVIAYVISADGQTGLNFGLLAAIGVGIWASSASKGKQEQDLKKQANFKRVYNYDMETVFKKVQLRMELAIQGARFWTPKLVEMSEGWIIYTYTIKKSVMGSSEIDSLSLMIGKAKDVSESLEEPKTELVLHFWCNTQLFTAGDLIKQAEWLVQGFDTALPKHQKLTVTDDDIIQVSAMAPSPAP